MPRVRKDGSLLVIETDCYHAAIATEDYVSGVQAGSFRDKESGAHDLGFGLMVVDFLLGPGADEPNTPEQWRYHFGDLFHGHIPKRYVELPQICTQAGRLAYEVTEGTGFAAVRQWFTWTQARPPYRPGSTWEQCLVFPDGVRWFACYDRVTSANAVDALLLRMDMPGHLQHESGDTFEEVYTSWVGRLPAAAFAQDFPPDRCYLYRREDGPIPTRFIKGYKIAGGPWLLGMCLEPGMVYESWCHQRGYVCMIHEIGGRPVKPGQSFGAVHLVGFFDSIEEAETLFDRCAPARAVHVTRQKWRLVA